MFSIHTPYGQTFSGPLEQLRRVKKPEASSTASRRRNQDENISLNRQNNDAFASNLPTTIVSKKAVEQYESMLTSSGQPEPVNHAYQIMSTNIVCLQKDWSITQCTGEFARHSYQVFPVLDQFNQLVGSLSRQQFYEYLLHSEKNEDPDKLTIEESFFNEHSYTYAVDPVTDVRRITTLLVEENIDALPVLSETGEVIGIVSRTDILRCASKNPPFSLWC